MSYWEKKIKNTFSNWANILNGVPQGSIGSTTFQWLSCNFFWFIPSPDLVSYADDNTSLAMGSLELEVIKEIKVGLSPSKKNIFVCVTENP